MPIFPTAEYRPSLLFRGEHLETIFPNLTRRRLRVSYSRFRIELRDGDFIDLDRVNGVGSESSKRCLLALHGLEGSSQAPYVKSLFHSLANFELDLMAMNLRGCSGELNRAARFYHSGETGDLGEVVEYLSNRYEEIFLLGFSLGGNVVLKYLGEKPESVSNVVKAAAAISAPIDLEGSALKIGLPENRFYMKRFVRLLSEKIEAKAEVYPEIIDAEGCRSILDFETFDGRYTAPLNGFASAHDYWRRCSALNWLSDIRCPTLLINARNDPFLSESCYPGLGDLRNDDLYLCYPDRGGHLGFPGLRVKRAAWHESALIRFLAKWSPAFEGSA